MATMSARILWIGNEVKITHGDSRGFFGKIVDITENEADIFLTMHDVTTTFPFSALRKYLKVGDEVVFTGPVRWTGKKTEIGLNTTAKDRTTGCGCSFTYSEFFRLPVAMFVEKSKNRKKPV